MERLRFSLGSANSSKLRRETAEAHLCNNMPGESWF